MSNQVEEEKYKSGPDGKTVIPLEFPVTDPGTKANVSQLKMRRAKIKDMTSVKHIKNAEDSEKTLFANLCEVSPELIEELDMVDYLQLQEVYEGFLSSRLKTASS